MAKLYFCQELVGTLPKPFWITYYPERQDFEIGPSSDRNNYLSINDTVIRVDFYKSLYGALYRVTDNGQIVSTYLLISQQPIENVEFEQADQDQLLEDLETYDFFFKVCEPSETFHYRGSLIDCALDERIRQRSED